MEENPALTSDEKLMAALAHFFGLVVALIVWAMQKDKSRFVRFQSIQALAFDGAVMAFSMFLSFCLVTVMMLGMFGTMYSVFDNPTSPESFGPLFLLPSMMPMAIFACVFPLSFAVLVVRLIAAISVFSGRDFRYPVLGKWTENFLKG